MRELIINCVSIVLVIASVVLAVCFSPLYLLFLLIPFGVLGKACLQYRNRERVLAAVWQNGSALRFA